jgi:hypothetical protein
MVVKTGVKNNMYLHIINEVAFALSFKKTYGLKKQKLRDLRFYTFSPFKIFDFNRRSDLLKTSTEYRYGVVKINFVKINF